MMLPMSIRCGTCGNYIYKGTKFNSRKEDVIGETYLGIQIFRFYFKCTKCSAEITFKTDPQNSDYLVETGATRNFEPWRSSDEATDDAKKKREAEELGDAMKALENRTIDSKREMDILAALDEMKSMRARHATVGTEEMLEALRRTADLKEKELAEEDEAVIRSVVFQGSSNYVRRLDDDDDDDDDVEGIQQPKKKKQKAGTLKGGVSGNQKQATSIQDDGPLPNAVAQGQATTDDAKHGPRAFAIRAQNIAFNVRPKNTDSIQERESQILPVIAGSTLSPSDQIQKNDADGPAGTGLASLCASYDSDLSD